MARTGRRGKGPIDHEGAGSTHGTATVLDDSVGCPSKILSNILKSLNFTFDKDIGMLDGKKVHSVPDLKTLNELKDQLDSLNSVLDDISNNDQDLIFKLREIRDNKIKEVDSDEKVIETDSINEDFDKETHSIEQLDIIENGQDVAKEELKEPSPNGNDDIEMKKDTDDVDVEEGIDLSRKRSLSESGEESNIKRMKETEFSSENNVLNENKGSIEPQTRNDAHLYEKDKDRMENDPNYKNPNSEFVISQTLPAAAVALGLYSEGGLETTGEEYLKKKYSVASYPLNDLKEYLPGELPDMDFSCPKPSNQIQFSTFLSSVDNFFSEFSDDDVKSLKTKYILPTNLTLNKTYDPLSTPYVIPKLGPLYSRTWLKEDKNHNVGNISPPSVSTPDSILPKKSSADINDSTLDTEAVSCGPLLSRLLSVIMRMEDENDDDDDDPKLKGDKISKNLDQNTTTIMNLENDSSNNVIVKQENGGAGTDPVNNVGVANDSGAPNKNEEKEQHEQELMKLNNNLSLVKDGIIPDQPALKIDNIDIDYPTFEERLKRELKYVGIYMSLPKDENSPNGDDPDWLTGREDDEVCAELRSLQNSLKSVTVKNEKRKAQLLPQLERYLAWQEYISILDDLDKQIDHAYIKRIRVPKKKKKHHHTPNVVQSASQIAQQKAANSSLRALLDKRKRWISKIGPLFESPDIMKRIPKESIFRDIDQEDEDEDADVFGQNNGNKEDELTEQ